MSSIALLRAPVVLFVFNRPRHTLSTLMALAEDPLAKETELFIFADGPRSPADAQAVGEVRALIRNLSGFKSVSIFEKEKNLGLAKSVIEGVTKTLDKFDEVIVMEDDLRAVPGFLFFMNSALSQYRLSRNVFAISGWSPKIELSDGQDEEVFLSPRALCWGWATWTDRWRGIDWDVSDFGVFENDSQAKQAFAAGGDDLPDMLKNAVNGRVDSWAVRWAYSQFRSSSFSLVPTKSFIENTGQDNTGTHSRAKFAFISADLAPIDWKPELPLNLKLNPHIARQIAKFYGYNWKAKVRKFFGRL